jgi:hypothetical protein
MTFLVTGRDTNGELLRIDMRVRPGGFASGEHIHPRQEERFQIDRGQITYREVLRGTSPPIVVQRILFATLAPLGRLIGYTTDVPYE